MAFRLTLFNSPKPRVFTYRPLYFDPEKEKWEQRRAQLHAQEEAEELALSMETGYPAGSKAAGSKVDHSPTDLPADLPTAQVPLFRRTTGKGPGANIRGSFQSALIESRRHSVENKYIRIIVLLSILLLFLVAIYLSNGLGFLFKSISNQPIP